MKRNLAGETLRWEHDHSRFDNFEPPVYQAFLNRLEPGMTVLDVGAWVGLYTVTAAKHGCHTVAFEPSPAARELLHRHLRLNNVEATIVSAAVSDRDGETRMYVQGASGWESISRDAAIRVELATGSSHLDEITVPTVTIDSFGTAHGLSPDLVKIDIEGAEVRALVGASQFLERQHGCLIIEAHPVALQHFGDSLAALHALLAEAGWTFECIFQRGTDTNPDRTVHYVAEPAP